MTLWTFNSGIPASNNDPSVDQPDMLNNNASTLGLIGTDHVTFNTQGPIGPPNGSGGQHLQVSFNGSNAPTVPTIVPTLFVNTQDGAGNALPGGIQELFFYSGSAAQGKNQYVSTANGSVVLTGGIIMKWGAPGLIGSPLAFPVAFPNNCFSVQVTSTNPSYTGSFTVTAVSASSFTVTRTSGSGNTGYYYIAMGN